MGFIPANTWWPHRVWEEENQTCILRQGQLLDLKNSAKSSVKVVNNIILETECDLKELENKINSGLSVSPIFFSPKNLYAVKMSIFFPFFTTDLTLKKRIFL